MKKQNPSLRGLITLMICLASVSSQAATLTFQPFAPTPGSNDIANLVGTTSDPGNIDGGNDASSYIAFDRGSLGQTFTTGTNAGGYQIRAVWLRHVSYGTTFWFLPPGGTFIIRVTDPAQTNTAGFALATETYTTTGSESGTLNTTFANGVGTGKWLRFGLSTPVSLTASTTYGFDITSQSANGGFGVNPFFETDGTNADLYAAGAAYSSGAAGVPGLDLIPAPGGVADHAFMVEMVGQALPPTIVTQPKNTMVPQGASTSFNVAVSGTSPFSFQWYFNSTNLLNGETNATLTLLGADTNLTGLYSTIVTNEAGSKTSSVARLSIVLPSTTTNFSFSSSGGTILDSNGVGTAFSTRLAGTGASLPASDPNLLLDTGSGTLDITSTTCDFHGQLLMDQAEAVGFVLSSIGFNGTQDFSVTGSFTNLPVGTYVNYDQVGIFVGASSTNFVRGGLIFNSDFASLSSYGVTTPGMFDAGLATAAAPPDEMVVTIRRSRANWGVSVNGRDVTPGASMDFLNAYTDLTAGVFALDTSGTHNVTRMDSLKASLFVPKLNAAVTGGNLTFTWNVVGAGLESNTNLANANGWTSVAPASTSPYVITVPTDSRKFYRIAQ